MRWCRGSRYLRRLLLEADFLRQFELDACVGVLERSSPDYVDLLINLYEPVATNAIGRALIGEDLAGLIISDEGRAEIARRLGPSGEAQRLRVLSEAALATCDSLDIDNGGATVYLGSLVPELLPRIEVGLSHGDLRGVFVG
jgi:hypothetical protein